MSKWLSGDNNLLKAYLFNQSIKIENNFLYYKKKKIPVEQIKDCRFDYYLTNESNFLNILSKQTYEQKIEGNIFVEQDIIENHDLLTSIVFVNICSVDTLCLSMAIKNLAMSKQVVI